MNSLEHQVTIPPRSSVTISIGTQESTDMQSVVEGNQHLLINHEICVARGIAELREGIACVMLTNFSNEYKYVSNGMTVAHIEEIM